MRFILFVEGDTEKFLPAFLKRWLDPRLSSPVGIKPVCFKGWQKLVKDTPDKAKDYLNGSQEDEIIAVIALLDLYGPTFYPKNRTKAQSRYDWAKKHLEARVNHPKFFQFFAVHETEAWLLSAPDIFPNEVKSALPGKIQHPESVNFGEPPAKLLDRIYDQKTGRHYKKVVHGKQLFSKLDPNVAYQKCPRLKELLEQMLKLAKEAGL